MKQNNTAIPRRPHLANDSAELRRRAESRLRDRRKGQRSRAGVPKSEVDAERLLQELQVHQVELEMQNAELQEARDRMETLVEKYTDLYDFAPVGYFSLNEEGRILEVNLTGAALLGVERSRLINRRLPVAPASQPIFLAFLKRVFAGNGAQVCETLFLKEGRAAFWASFGGISAISADGPVKWCRVAISDITALKQAEATQRRSEVLAASNQKLEQEIVRRRAVEKALRKSEQDQTRLLEQSRRMQEQLRRLSHQILQAQEDERKRISRELHDVIAQTLTSINLQLSALKKEAETDPKGIEQSIGRTQQLVERSVSIVHQFARELRPTVLDDLGLIPALHTFLKTFKAETGIHVSLSAFAAIEEVHGDKRTMLYRIAQEALNNVARHARASRVEVSVQKLDGAICMKIKDNGRGFPAKRALHAKNQKRLGLLGMRERMEMVSGSFTVESTPGKGTTIQVQIPLANGRAG